MNKKDLTNEEKLDAIYEMTLENHEVLKSIRRQQYFASFTRIFYWLLVLGFVGGAYYYVRPFITTLTTNGSMIQQTLDQFFNLRNQLPETKALNEFLEKKNRPQEVLPDGISE
jgi:hypothetical protein